MKTTLIILLIMGLVGCSSEAPPITADARAQIQENAKVLNREMKYREKTRQLNAETQERLLEQDATDTQKNIEGVESTVPTAP